MADVLSVKEAKQRDLVPRYDPPTEWGDQGFVVVDEIGGVRLDFHGHPIVWTRSKADEAAGNEYQP